MIHKVTGLMAAWLLAGSVAQAGLVFDVAADFSPTRNPNGAWSFGSTGSLSGPLTPFTSRSTFADGGTGGGTLDVLHGAGGLFPSVFHNGSSLTYESTDPGPGLTPGRLALHAGASTLSVARFTAPVSGLYEIEAMFYGVTSDTTSIFVVLNGSSLFAGSHSGFAPGNSVSFGQQLALGGGDSVDFVVGNGGDGNFFDWVGLDARLGVVAVPEPKPAVSLLSVVVGITIFTAGRWAGGRSKVVAPRSRWSGA